jgi:hypothetical protein
MHELSKIKLFMYNSKSLLTLFIAVLFTIALFTGTPKLQAKPVVNSQISVSHNWDNTASFLAGLETKDDPEFSAIASDESYLKYSSFMNTLWQGVEKETINPVRQWSSVIPKEYQNAPVFYPLSGADFVNMYLMYPDALEYTMIAMEDAGNVSLSKDPKELLQNLQSLKNAIHLYALNNYFQTRIMKDNFTKNHNIQGTVPVLLVFMKKMGLKIHDVRLMYPSVEGAVITFSDPAEGKKIRTLYYYTRKLSNDSTANEFGFTDDVPGYRLIMKSAVYLLQMPQYSNLKKTIYNRALMVIQDDSGIPYEMFKNSDWTVSLFGSYHRIEVAGTLYKLQKDLQEDFKSIKEPLPFQFGYGAIVGKRKSNLMIAVRNKAGKQTGENVQGDAKLY